MKALEHQYNWQNQSNLTHWIKHIWMPVFLIGVFLLLPKPWQLFNSQNYFPSFEIQLKNDINKPSTKPEPEPEPEILTPKEASELSKPEAKQTPPVKTKPNPINEPKVNNAPVQAVAKPEPIKQPTKKITSGDILLSVKNRTSVAVPLEFQARSTDAKNFYIPQQEIEDWFSDIPYLDESKDRPTIQMKFYAEGIEGALEKFFDKITISKTFTTKYGTKIHCALVGVIVACGWK